MTHAFQLSPLSSDYFNHKPRSFLSLHTNYDVKLTPNHGEVGQPPYTPSRGRRTSRAMAYAQPSPSLNSSTVGAGRPRAPLRRTLLRVSLLCALLLLAGLGWCCESVGCSGRGGGGLVGSYVGGGSVVVGWGAAEVPEVVKGWGTAEGMDLSAYWGAPASIEENVEGGEEVGEEAMWTGELVGLKGVDPQTGEVVWDDEEAIFGTGEVSGGPDEEAEVEAQQVEGDAKPDGTARDENADGDDEAAEGVVGAVKHLESTATVDDVAENAPAQYSAQQDEALPLAQRKGWIGSLGGFF
ncbi:hypothetical protein B5807_01958 [Epicoccum nigrum]|uniref:Uncharacterized protein n=1 Tax=Epicoccum nigrum TaxID=105696 RepID=A0A1Y2MAZ8_EPING|nr:hypothetical protein B5807_01958 [Epicoccum nigrum]